MAAAFPCACCAPESPEAERGEKFETKFVKRILSLILIVLGLYLLGSAWHAEYCGITTLPETLAHGARGGYSNSRYLYRRLVYRQYDPERFRQYMLTHWLYASVIEVAGWMLYLRTRELANL